MAKAILKAYLVFSACLAAGALTGYGCFSLLFGHTNNEGFMGFLLLIVGGSALLGLVVGVVWAVRIINDAR